MYPGQFQDENLYTSSLSLILSHNKSRIPSSSSQSQNGQGSLHLCAHLSSSCSVCLAPPSLWRPRDRNLGFQPKEAAPPNTQHSAHSMTKGFKKIVLLAQETLFHLRWGGRKWELSWIYYKRNIPIVLNLPFRQLPSRASPPLGILH